MHSGLDRKDVVHGDSSRGVRRTGLSLEHGEEQRPCAGPGALLPRGLGSVDALLRHVRRWDTGASVRGELQQSSRRRSTHLQEQKCNVEPCPQDCVGAWSGWSGVTPCAAGGEK